MIARKVCGLPWRCLWITISGDCYPCCFGPGGMSSIGEAGPEVWQGPQITELRAAVLAGNPPSQCRDCRAGVFHAVEIPLEDIHQPPRDLDHFRAGNTDPRQNERHAEARKRRGHESPAKRAWRGIRP